MVCNDVCNYVTTFDFVACSDKAFNCIGNKAWFGNKACNCIKNFAYSYIAYCGVNFTYNRYQISWAVFLTAYCCSISFQVSEIASRIACIIFSMPCISNNLFSLLYSASASQYWSF